MRDLRYESTRGGFECAFPQTLLKGIADNGGLFVPKEWPQFTQKELEHLLHAKTYHVAADLALRKFLDWRTRRQLKFMLARAYTPTKFGPVIVPVQRLAQKRYLLKVSDGPTWAFKDIALQLLGELLEFWLEERDAHLNIIVATSGDTGSATIEALRGRKRIRVFVLSPKQGSMSEIQKRQMYGVKDKRIFNLVLDGTFDDAQAILKEIFADESFRDAYHLGLVNSINWSRIIAQTVYFVWAWSRISDRADAEVTFSVPSGNFGDAYAAYVAKMMGIPVRQIIVATNENDVLDRFFKTGRYDGRSGKPLAPTFSPSMDIKVASNFERLLADAFGRDGPTVEALMARMKPGGEGWFDISDMSQFAYFADKGFVSGSCSDAETLDAISYARTHYSIYVDPHTAVAIHVGVQKGESNVPIVFVETARWEKFPETLSKALGSLPKLPAKYHGLMRRKNHSHRLVADTVAVKHFIARKLQAAA